MKRHRSRERETFLAPLRIAALVLLSLVTAACRPAQPAADGHRQGASAPAAKDDAPRARAALARASDEDDIALPIAADDAVRGRRDALITLVVFSDFQCPFCMRHAKTLDLIEETYRDDVRIVFKHQPLPFHAHARFAAEVAQGVLATRGRDAFWRFHDMAFRRQASMGEEAIRTWAIAAGADSSEIESGLERHLWAQKVERDVELATRFGANGTPWTFINGISLSGAHPFERFKAIIEDELPKAKAAAATGIPRERVYRQRVAENDPKKPPPDQDDDDDDARAAAAAEVWKVPVGSSPVRGSSSALVTIVLFSDFQCPFCKRVGPTLERLRAEYGDRLRVVWKDQPLSFHLRAIPAAQLARAARAQKGDAGFWAVHDRLFESQPALEDSDLEEIAKAAKLDVTKAMAAVKANTYTSAVDADVSLADDVRASGTPHFFINGRRIAGAQPYDKFKALVDEELAKAEGLVKSGVAKNRVYDAIIKDGKSAPEPERRAVAPARSAPFRGAANAKVVIQEFSDFQCPFCARAEPTLDALLKAYPGKIKIVWRHRPLPMHPDAPLAAEAAHEAFSQKGNDGFSKMREIFFAHQGDSDGFTRPALERYASEIGLDMMKFRKALDERTHRSVIDAEVKAANDADITGTPSFTIGPYFLRGAQPLTRFKKLVDRVLAEPARGAGAERAPADLRADYDDERASRAADLRTTR